MFADLVKPQVPLGLVFIYPAPFPQFAIIWIVQLKSLKLKGDGPLTLTSLYNKKKSKTKKGDF
jgi:hypothetical protein